MGCDFIIIIRNNVQQELCCWKGTKKDEKSGLTGKEKRKEAANFFFHPWCQRRSKTEKCVENDTFKSSSSKGAGISTSNSSVGSQRNNLNKEAMGHAKSESRYRTEYSEGREEIGLLLIRILVLLRGWAPIELQSFFASDGGKL